MLRKVLLLALLISCWVIAIRFDIDLVNLDVVSNYLWSDFTRVYAYNPPYGRFFYGPISLVLIAPFKFLSYPVVKYFWISLQTICFFYFWNLLQKNYSLLTFKNWFLVFIFAINPIHNNFQSNNIQLMLMVLLLLGHVFAIHPSPRKQFLGGMFIVLPGMIKVFPLFMVPYYILTGSKKVRLGMLCGVFLSIILPVLFFGFENSRVLFQDFLRGLATYSEDNSLTKVEDILCLPSLLTRYFGQGRWISVLISGLAASFYLWIMFLKDKNSKHVWALALALMTFLNPSSRPHYFIFYIPAFCSLLELTEGIKWVPLFLSFLFICFSVEGVIGKTLNNQLEYWNIPTYGFLILIVLLTLELRTLSYRR